MTSFLFRHDAYPTLHMPRPPPGESTRRPLVRLETPAASRSRRIVVDENTSTQSVSDMDPQSSTTLDVSLPCPTDVSQNAMEDTTSDTAEMQHNVSDAQTQVSLPNPKYETLSVMLIYGLISVLQLLLHF